MKLVGFLISILVLKVSVLSQAQVLDQDSFLKPSIWRSQVLFQSLQGSWTLHRNPQASKNLPFDFLIVNSDWSKALLFKESFQIQSQDFAETLEFEKQKYLVVAVGLKSFEWQEIKQSLQRDQQTSALFSFFQNKSFASSACAISEKKNSLVTTTLSLNEKSYLQQVGDCSLQALSGAKNQGLEMLQFFQDLAKNPTELVSRIRDSFLAFKDLVMDLKKQTQQMLQGIQGLTAAQKQELACTITGEVLMGVGTGILLPGSAAQFAAKIPMRLEKIKQSLAQVQVLKSQGFLVPEKVFTQAVTCAR